MHQLQLKCLQNVALILQAHLSQSRFALQDWHCCLLMLLLLLCHSPAILDNRPWHSGCVQQHILFLATCVLLLHVVTLVPYQVTACLAKDET